MRLPLGSDTDTCSPGPRPSRASATGDSADRRPSAGAASCELTIRQVCSAPSWSRTTTVEPKPTIPPDGGRLLDDDRGGDLLAQPRDLRLEVGLLVLGVVVLAVLLQIAPLARGLDPLGDLPAPLPLELGELGVEGRKPLGGRQVRRVGHSDESLLARDQKYVLGGEDSSA